MPVKTVEQIVCYQVWSGKASPHGCSYEKGALIYDTWEEAASYAQGELDSGHTVMVERELMTQAEFDELEKE